MSALAEQRQLVEMNRERLQRYIDLSSTSPVQDKERVLPEGPVVIHVDVNQTVVFMDSVQGKQPLEVVNHVLATTLVDVWSEGTEPMTYFEWVYTQYDPREGPGIDDEGGGDRACRAVPPVNDKASKKARMEKIRVFTTHLELHSDRFPYAGLACTVRDLAIAKLASNQELYGTDVLPSFFHMIRVLGHQNVQFRIVLRTFGKDLDKTAVESTKHTGIEFGSTVDLRDESLYEAGPQESAGEDKGRLELKPSTVESLHATCRRGHTKVQDYFQRWNTAGEIPRYGKPFPVDLNDPYGAVFLDDNARSKGIKRIVGAYDVSSGKEIDLDHLEKTGVLVRADALDALFNQNYFLDIVARALENKSKTQAAGSSLVGRSIRVQH